MLRAMDSAVAGLRAHQNKMDVVGHNIANVNTFGYKAQTYTFKEAMYQTSTASTAGAGGANGSAGTNAAQYGYGTLMGSIGMDMTSSTPSYVGGFNATIDGEGFFITSPEKKTTGFGADADIKGENFNYTRVGQFMVDSNGYIVDANKNFVYGYRSELTDGKVTGTADELTTLRLPIQNNPGDDLAMGDEADDKPVISIAIEVNAFGKITATVQMQEKITDPNDATKTEIVKTSKTIEIGQLAIATFQNPNGLTKAGGNYYVTNENDNAGQVAAGKPGEGGAASLMTGYIESSNVDLAKEFADMITTHRGFQANSKMITVSDEILQELVNMKR